MTNDTDFVAVKVAGGFHLEASGIKLRNIPPYKVLGHTLKEKDGLFESLEEIRKAVRFYVKGNSKSKSLKLPSGETEWVYPEIKVQELEADNAIYRRA